MTAFRPIRSETIRSSYIRKKKTGKNIQNFTLHSFVILVVTAIFQLKIQILLEQIQQFEKQRMEIKKERRETRRKTKNDLLTITGIRSVIIAVIMDTMSDMHCFKQPNQ
ncbi:hypothetical protein CN553_28995 [Bacillus cereus]|uniref:Uncharacterized protein n=1 Tax=Bacillus cereus TaxID=1396 RepID=A0A9X6U675_BACCE|nr:hypothetical protein CN553_28995 [Bacillus cereus]